MYPVKKEKIIHEKVLETLRNNPKGFTMTELVRNTKFSRKAIEKHLQVLILENEIYMKQFGVTKVYYPNHRIHHFDFEKISYNNKTIWFDILENEYGKYLLIQKKKKEGNGWIHEHSITIPLEQAIKFSNALDKVLNSVRIKALIKK
ncbi:hypothetical protein HYV89_05355 [Candidatus Woesearchaeota archaeon]|nr:hypothetical protein [Candidatus Woesearchaeota archaeon]